MNLLLCLLLLTQKPGTSQPTLTGWEVPVILGAAIGVAIAKFGIQDSKGAKNACLPVEVVAESKPAGKIPVIESRRESVTLPQQPPQNPNKVEKVELSVSPPEALPPATQEAASPQLTLSNDITEVLDRLSREDGSTALCGDPGTGKSTITRQYIHKVQVNCPNADIRVLAIKNDDFCGLRSQGRVTRFIGDEAIENAGRFFDDISAEYRQRLELLEDERDTLTPFVIILDDWLNISSVLNKVEPVFEFGQVLFNILTIGREYNMKFFVNLHSLNLAAIGIKELDSTTRKILKILVLGNRYKKDSREIDAYGIIEQAISGSQVANHPQDKQKIREQYTHYKAESRTKLQPVMFAFVGEYYVGLVPNFSTFSTVTKIEAPEMTVTELLKEPLLTIWKAAQKHGNWLTARDIVRSNYAVLKGKNTTVEIVGFVQELKKMGFLEISDELGQALRFRHPKSEED